MLEVRLLYKQLENYNKVLEQTVAERTAELRESEARFRALPNWRPTGIGSRMRKGILQRYMDRFSICSESRSTTCSVNLKETAGARWNDAEYAVFKANIEARRPLSTLCTAEPDPTVSNNI